MRSVLLFAAAAAAVPDVPAPPAALAAYVKGGHFFPGDYGWYRGALTGAAAEDVARWKEVAAWKAACLAADRARVDAELRALGLADAELPPGTYDDGLCGDLIDAQPHFEKKVSLSEFDAALARARSIATTVTWSARLAQAAADPDEATPASELKARPATDQVLRAASTWNDGEVKGAPQLSPVEQGITEGIIWSAIRARDHDNTRWLKALVAKSGWPTISRVGAEASSAAWLLVQHADDDPVFQYRMLQLMRPLAAKGEVSRSNFGYLYDRVMLKLAGKQRYGTQMTCSAGRYRPLPLEDPSRLDQYRAEAGMSSSEENAARLVKTYGPCAG